jgi:hypothetical protein
MTHVNEVTQQIRADIEAQLNHALEERQRLQNAIGYFQQQLEIATRAALKNEGAVESAHASLAKIDSLLNPIPAAQPEQEEKGE